jgi:hypothetical protein
VVSGLGRERVLAGFLAQHAEVHVRGLSDLGTLYLEGAARREAQQRVIESAQQRWEESLAEQQALANRLASLSPSALLTTTLIELADAGRSRYLDFMRQKRAYERAYDSFFLARKLALPNSVFRSADYYLIPAMRCREESLSAVFRRTQLSLLTLVFLTALVSSGATRLVWTSDRLARNGRRPTTAPALAESTGTRRA